MLMDVAAVALRVRQLVGAYEASRVVRVAGVGLLATLLACAVPSAGARTVHTVHGVHATRAHGHVKGVKAVKGKRRHRVMVEERSEFVAHAGTLLQPGRMPEGEIAGDAVTLAAMPPMQTPSDVHAMSGDAAPMAAGADAGIATEATAPMAETQPNVVAAALDAPKYMLHLRRPDMGEQIDIVYRVGDEYVPSAIEKLDAFLHDKHTMDVTQYDPSEFDLLHNLLVRLGRPEGEIDVVCGYRTEWTNEMLRHLGRHTGVAKNSQHVQGRAIDIRIPGMKAKTVRDAALSLQAGGVGYYPVHQFVHVDVGPVRHWTFRGRGV